MVFSSLPIYLDPPNWNQIHQHPAPNQSATGGSRNDDAHQLPVGVAAQRPEAAAIRPGSMAERARLAKIPQPELALKCPRCDSTNTKFCYFNNYSLSQPRHFCKTCRRYWTRGGALRNVPVGGGCRRNKRSKAGGGGLSKSQATGGQSGTSSSSSTATSGGGAIPSNMLMPTQLPFMASLHSLADYSVSNNMGMNFSGIQHNDTVEFQLGSSPGLGLEQWRIQQIHQFPFLGGLDPPMALPPPPALPSHGLFQFDDVASDGFAAQALPKASSSGLITQFAAVKMEDNSQGLSLPRQYLGIPGNDQYNWGISGGASSGGGWLADLSSFNASSSSNLL